MRPDSLHTPTRATATPGTARHWRPLLLLALTLAVVGATLLSGAVPCTFAKTTGLPCPGCGAGRSMRAALDGDWLLSVQLNPLGAASGVVMVGLGLLALATVFRHGTTAPLLGDRWAKRGFVLLLSLAVLQALVWIARFFGWFGGPVPV